jgi:hypothetical protein
MALFLTGVSADIETTKGGFAHSNETNLPAYDAEVVDTPIKKLAALAVECENDFGGGCLYPWCEYEE